LLPVEVSTMNFTIEN